MSPWAAYGVVGELGYLIAIPAIVFGVGGAYADKYFHTSPILLIIGFMVAAWTSYLAVRRVIERLNAKVAKYDATHPALPKVPDDPEEL